MRMSEPSTANFWTSSSKLVYATAFLLQVLLMRQRTCQRTMCAGSAEKNLDPSRHGAVTLSRYMAGPMRADTYKKDLLASLVADCIPRMNVWSAISGLMPLVVRLWRHSVDFFEAQPYYGSKGVQARIPMDSMKTWLPTMDPVAPRGDGWPMTSAMWSCLRILAPLRSLSNYQPFRCTTASFRIS